MFPARGEAEPLMVYDPRYPYNQLPDFYRAYVDNSSSTRVVFPDVDLRPGGRIPLVPIHLVSAASLAGQTLTAKWTATSKDKSGIARGEIGIEVSTSIVSPLPETLEP